MKRIRSLWLVLPLFVFLAGCDFYDADLETHWTFDGYGCRAAGVDYVEVVLEDDEGYVHESGLVPCRDGSLLFPDLPSGRARIWAWGYRSPRSGYSWELYRRVRIHEGYNELTLDLAPVY